MGSFHSPNLFFTNGTHKILDMGLCEMLVIVIQQFAVDRGHCHKYINPWSFRTQELFPNLEGDRKQHSAVRRQHSCEPHAASYLHSRSLLLMGAVSSTAATPWGSLGNVDSARNRQETGCCCIQKASCELCILPHNKLLIIFHIKVLKFPTSCIFISI